MKEIIKKLLRENLDFGPIEPKKEVVSEEIIVNDITLTLYRGLRNMFDNSQHNPELVEDGNDYKLLVDKYPDKLIWFSDDENFAKKYNGWGIITYPLLVKKHTKIVTYKDGTTENKNVYGNEQVLSGFGRGELKSDPYKNSYLYNGIELPNNWFWSYKTEKHIVCNSDLIINKNMIKINKNEK